MGGQVHGQIHHPAPGTAITCHQEKTMTEKSNPNERTVPFWPDHVLYEAKVALWFGIGLLIIGVIGLFSPAGLGDPADPMVTPEHTKPEWYFLALYQLLKYLPKTIGAVTPVIFVLILFIWPFIDRKPDTSQQDIRLRMKIAAAVVLLAIVLSIFGELS